METISKPFYGHGLSCNGPALWPWYPTFSGLPDWSTEDHRGLGACVRIPRPHVAYMSPSHEDIVDTLTLGVATGSSVWDSFCGTKPLVSASSSASALQSPDTGR